MFKPTFNHYEEWSWIIQQEEVVKHKHVLHNNPYGLFNLGFINQNDTSGAHRFGWQYVYNNIKSLHRENCDLNLDLYIDKTFHWDKEINKAVGIIPYTKSWIGFIHHTFDTSFSDYNCYNLFENDLFIQSLRCCKGLIVLSEYLKNRLQSELDFIGINVKVYSITHPTDTCVPKFTIDKFLKNQGKNLVHVGGWLRNIYSFYKLSLPKNLKLGYGFLLGDTLTKNPLGTYDCSLEKTVLRGKYMSNYYPTTEFLPSLQNVLANTTVYSDGDGPNISRNISQNVSVSPMNTFNNRGKVMNNWYKHFFSDVTSMLKSVQTLNYLQNSCYDELMTQNIIFLNLVDASGINTLIECIVRHTPVIVNKHPAVVEHLGDNYPLYFTNQHDNYELIQKEVFSLLKDTNNIKKAYYHIRGIDVKRYSIQTFISELALISQ